MATAFQIHWGQPRRMVFVSSAYGKLPICICWNCRDNATWPHDAVGMHPYRRFLRQQRAARKARRGWA